jgi:excisionase family DNA binding protein
VGPPRHCLRPDVAGSPPTRGPTGDRERRKPAVGAALSGAGPAGGVGYRELERAANGSPEQIRALGDARLLPRPWEPASCSTPQLRQQLWCWLEEVVEWLVAEYAAERLGIGRTVMYALVGSGAVESVQIGRLRRVPADALVTLGCSSSQLGKTSDGAAEELSVRGIAAGLTVVRRSPWRRPG